MSENSLDKLRKAQKELLDRMTSYEYELMISEEKRVKQGQEEQDKKNVK